MDANVLFSPAVLLWLFGALVAFFLLVGSMSRRRFSLTELLRAYVGKRQSDFSSVAPNASQEPADNKRRSAAPPNPESPNDS
jgi:hypothetical protein